MSKDKDLFEAYKGALSTATQAAFQNEAMFRNLYQNQWRPASYRDKFLVLTPEQRIEAAKSDILGGLKDKATYLRLMDLFSEVYGNENANAYERLRDELRYPDSSVDEIIDHMLDSIRYEPDETGGFEGLLEKYNPKPKAITWEFANRKAGKPPKDIVMETGKTKGQVAGVIYRHENPAVPSKVDIPRKKSPKASVFPPPQVVKRPENKKIDTAQWISERDKLLSAYEFVRVMHLNDLHLPYYDPLALNTWFAIAEKFKPQIVVLGSDMFDLPHISKFEIDRDIPLDDWQDRSRACYWPLVNNLDNLLPDALFVWIYGNHDRRGLLDIKASKTQKIGMKYFLKTIRAKGRVFHLGRTESLDIGRLIVAHGNKANKYAAASIGAYPDWRDKKVNFGHIHRHQVIDNAWSNGCLCQLIPFYNDWQYPITQTQGTSTILANQNNVLWEYHHFERDTQGIVTSYNGEVLKVR
jgi:hypothetical protein